jgi:hypothetical protein
MVLLILTVEIFTQIFIVFSAHPLLKQVFSTFIEELPLKLNAPFAFPFLSAVNVAPFTFP